MSLPSLELSRVILEDIIADMPLQHVGTLGCLFLQMAAGNKVFLCSVIRLPPSDYPFLVSGSCTSVLKTSEWD